MYEEQYGSDYVEHEPPDMTCEEFIDSELFSGVSQLDVIVYCENIAGGFTKPVRQSLVTCCVHHSWQYRMVPRESLRSECFDSRFKNYMCQLACDARAIVAKHRGETRRPVVDLSNCFSVSVVECMPWLFELYPEIEWTNIDGGGGNYE